MVKKKSKKKIKEIKIGKIKESEPIEKPVTKKVKELESKQLFWILFGIVLMIVIFLGAYFYVQSLNTFKFAGVTWEKEEYQNLNLYHARFKVMEGFPTYNAYFRTDPRKNDVQILNGTYFKFYKDTYISLSPNVEVCGGANVIANKLLGEFFLAVGVNAQGAIAEEDRAKELNLTYMDCSIIGDEESVVLIKKSDKLEIKQFGKNCYQIDVGDCENIKAAEQFILGIMNQLSDIENALN